MLFSTCMMSYLPNLVVVLATVLAGGEKHAVHVPVPVCRSRVSRNPTCVYEFGHDLHFIFSAGPGSGRKPLLRAVAYM